jgi:predicted PurR-regulated permease PerM
MAQDNFISKVVAIGLVLLLFLIAFLILKPIFMAILVGLIVAYIFHPIYMILRKKIKSDNLAASLLMIISFLIVAIPLWFLAPLLINQTFETFRYLQQVDFAQVLKNILPHFFNEQNSAAVAIHLNNFISTFFSSILTNLSGLASNLPGLAIKIVVMLFTFFFATRDAHKFKEYIFSLSPFSQKTGEKFLTEFRNITNAIVYGQIAIGVIQGLALGIGLWILGAPSPLLLTALTMIISIIPVLGAWLIWLPVGIVMILSGKVIAGGILLIYGALIVSLLDNFLRPYFLSRKSTLPISIALIGTIGGFYTLGIIGLLIGPLILAYLLIVVDFYRQGKLKELFSD